MATFRFEVNNKPTKSKTYYVLLCITTDGKRKRLKTSVEIRRPSDFNTKARQGNWIRPSEPNYKVWNDALSNELEAAKGVYRDAKESGLATSERIKAEIVAGERTSSFLEYARERTQQIYQAGGLRNWKKYNGFVNKLTKFCMDKYGRVQDLTFAELTPALLSKFERHLQSLRNERDSEKTLHPNTIAVNFTIFKSIVKRAEMDGFIKPEKNPFLAYSYKGIPTIKDKLNVTEIAVIEAMDLPASSPLWHCRNYFMFSFYCAGIRAGDLIQLRWCNITSDGRVHYQMGKNHKDKDLKLMPQAKAILEHYRTDTAKPTDYIFPLLDSTALYAVAVTQEDKDTMPPDVKKRLFDQISAKNAYINKNLRELTAQAGIDKKVSFHISRHSFAKVAKQKGIDNAVLKEMLNHSSLKNTEIYMGNFDTSESDEAMESIFGTQQPADDSKAKLLAKLDGMTSEQIATLLGQVEN